MSFCVKGQSEGEAALQVRLLLSGSMGTRGRDAPLSRSTSFLPPPPPLLPPLSPYKYAKFISDTHFQHPDGNGTSERAQRAHACLY